MTEVINGVLTAQEFLKPLKVVASIDVAQRRDFSVLTILECYDRIREHLFNEDGEKYGSEGREYHLAFQEQKRGLDYVGQCEWIVSKLDAYKNEMPKFTRRYLVVEVNGIGLSLYDMLRKNIPTGWKTQGVLLTAGESIALEDNVYHLPKREVINSLIYMLDHGNLKIPHDLPTKTDLFHQASGFIRTVTESGKEKMESDTESRHDDLIMSLAHAAWYSIYKEQNPPKAIKNFLEMYKPDTLKEYGFFNSRQTDSQRTLFKGHF